MAKHNLDLAQIYQDILKDGYRQKCLFYSGKASESLSEIRKKLREEDITETVEQIADDFQEFKIQIANACEIFRQYRLATQKAFVDRHRLNLDEGITSAPGSFEFADCEDIESIPPKVKAHGRVKKLKEIYDGKFLD
jgi:hypothetical protein